MIIILYQELININQYVTGIENNIRDNLNEIDIINNAIMSCLYDDDISDNYIRKCIYLAALIKLYQPFKDGNNRSALIMLWLFLNKNNICFDLEQALIDLKKYKLNISTIYSEEDKITNKDKIIKYIK